MRGLGESFAVEPSTGTGSLTVPLPLSPARGDFTPELSLAYDSGGGNGPFGLGWALSTPAITRRTDRGLPTYRDVGGPGAAPADDAASDVFLLSGAEDLVPVLDDDGQPVEDRDSAPGFVLHHYRPRIEGLLARIERWTELASGAVHWRSVSGENVTTLYGRTAASRVADPADPLKVFAWKISESYDDRGNRVVYEYRAEDSVGVDRGRPRERGRTDLGRSAQRYLSRVLYGNRVSRLVEADPADPGWAFEVVFDYDDGRLERLPLDPDLAEEDQLPRFRASAGARAPWPQRPDPFSTRRPGFEVRTDRRCRRVMVFHRFPELGDEPTLVRCLELDHEDFDAGFENAAARDAALAQAPDTERRHPGSSRYLSRIRRVHQWGFVRDEAVPVVDEDGVPVVTYRAQGMPPLELTYSTAQLSEEIQALEAGELGPTGLAGPGKQWVDLDGEGLSGLLGADPTGGWTYRRNRGAGRFGAPLSVDPVPAAAASEGPPQLLDLAGDGRLELVDLDGPTPGFYERSDPLEISVHEGAPTSEPLPPPGWATFQAFESLPNLDWDSPDLRFVDLTGDGRADLLLTEDEVFTWYPSLGEEGFGPGRRVSATSLDEERGPKLVRGDGREAIYLADLTGDGLADLVRVRRGEVCFWPSLGHGRFGARVVMEGSPTFDRPDAFDPRRLRLADLDGSGPVDLVYLGRDGVDLYFNQSGNGWSAPRHLAQAPPAGILGLEGAASVDVVDLLGNGTGCLVWSSALPGDAAAPVRYVDLFGGTKPHLLLSSDNHLGAEIRLSYAPSTKSYLADREAGTPWITRLPFPVHVVERQETLDRVSGQRFVRRYSYHHGFFDGVEREFRGFGRVDQWDSELLSTDLEEESFANEAAASRVPPVLTRSWYHTGFHRGREALSARLAAEGYRPPGLDDAEARARLLPDTPLPPGLSLEEERQACRALKGRMLRQEVYGLDGSDREPHPYLVEEHSHTVRLLQGQQGQRHAVFLVHGRESLSAHRERRPEDARLTHQLTLAVDAFGNVLRSASVAYGRSPGAAAADPQLTAEDRARQGATRIVLTEGRYTDPLDGAVDGLTGRRNPLPAEEITTEITGLAVAQGIAGQPLPANGPPAGRPRWSWEEVEGAISGLLGAGAPPVAFEAEPPANALARRLVTHQRTLYRRDDLDDGLGLNGNGPLPLGTVGLRALPFEGYQLAFTPGLLAEVYGDRVDEALLRESGHRPNAEAGGPAGDPADETSWWLPSGRLFYSPDPAHDAAQELAFARQRFFLPHRQRDPFHRPGTSTETVVTYDPHHLLAVEHRDALGNESRAEHDYRVLQPTLLTDPNGQRSGARYDARGLVVATALLGKAPPAAPEGDTLDAVPVLLTEGEVRRHREDPLGLGQGQDAGTAPADLLGGATRRFVPDLWAVHRTRHREHPEPAAVTTLAREVHGADLAPGETSPIEVSLAYSDGFGREIQSKLPAEPGPVPRRDAEGRVLLGPDGNPLLTAAAVAPRWVGTGWVVHDNKGQPVRQYEPFFTDRSAFERERAVGVSPVMGYDPTGRLVVTLSPDHTWEKVAISSWRQERWDVHDTLLVADPRTDPDAGDWFARQEPDEVFPTWHQARSGGALGQREREAAAKAAVHAETPEVTHGDALGRPFLVIHHNRWRTPDLAPGDPAHEDFHPVRARHDLAGRTLAVTDGLGRLVERTTYDLLGRTLLAESFEAGTRWTLPDAREPDATEPTATWDSRGPDGNGHRRRTVYDALRRPTELRLRLPGAADEVQVGRTEYGEGEPDPEAANLRGRVVRTFDQAGVVTAVAYDLAGRLVESERRVAEDYRGLLDWSGAGGQPPALLPEVHTSRSRFDALGRPVLEVHPDGSRVRPTYNEANLLERLEVQLRGETDGGGEPVWTPFVTATDHDAKGQPLAIAYGNGTETRSAYDPRTFRLVRRTTFREPAAFPDDCPQPAPPGWPGCGVQSLVYTYDAAGNPTHVEDRAQQQVFFRNRRVEPSSDYTYDALYRLLEATGREHLGQGQGGPGAPLPHGPDDGPRVRIPHPGDGNALGTYRERYAYDRAGNLLEVVHRGSDPASPGWRRSYAYEEASLLEAGAVSNRLTRTVVGDDAAGGHGIVETYSVGGDGYDPHGNLLKMPHLSAMTWDFRDQLRSTRRQVGGQETTWYVYDAAGQRVRKVTESAPGVIREERLYLEGVEIYRRGGIDPLARETLTVTTGEQVVARVETRTEGVEPGIPTRLVRYQLEDLLGSVALELDAAARVISYEEHSPYGSTTYQAVRRQTEAPKRYRFTGKERDEESGFTYHGARYYAPWLGRWTSCDPLRETRLNAYEYVNSRPTVMVDPDGKDGEFRFNVSLGLRFGTHENRLYLQTDAFAAYRNGFVGEAGLSVQTFPFNRHWGLDISGWETAVTLSGAVGGQVNPEPSGDPTLPNPTPFGAVGGLAFTWYGARSFGPGGLQGSGGLAASDQRLGVPFLRFDFGYNSLMLSTRNDTALVGGDGGDSFRSARVDLDYTHTIRTPTSITDLTFGLTLDLVTGLVDRDRLVPGSVDPQEYDMSGQPFGDLSQGALFFTFGVDHAEIGGDRSFRSFGGSLSIGADAEILRHLTQNRLIHDSFDPPVPHFPMLDRPGRLYLNSDLYLGGGSLSPGIGNLQRPHAGD